MMYRFTHMKLYCSSHVSEAGMVQVLTPLRWYTLYTHIRCMKHSLLDVYVCDTNFVRLVLLLFVCAFWSNGRNSIRFTFW